MDCFGFEETGTLHLLWLFSVEFDGFDFFFQFEDVGLKFLALGTGSVC